MPLTLRDLLRDLDVRSVAGEAGLDRPVRWVHISELEDPTPWLSGGELLLTTGLPLGDARQQRAYLERLAEHGLAGLGFGAGFFQAIELVKDKETKESFDDAESEELLRGFLSGELFRRGLICRADDRGDPVIQFSPPLIATPEHFAEIESVLRPTLEEAWRKVQETV